MGNTSGSIKKITFDGIPFDVMSDSNFNETETDFEHMGNNGDGVGA